MVRPWCVASSALRPEFDCCARLVDEGVGVWPFLHEDAPSLLHLVCRSLSHLATQPTQPLHSLLHLDLSSSRLLSSPAWRRSRTPSWRLPPSAPARRECVARTITQLFACRPMQWRLCTSASYVRQMSHPCQQHEQQSSSCDGTNTCTALCFLLTTFPAPFHPLPCAASLSTSTGARKRRTDKALSSKCCASMPAVGRLARFAAGGLRLHGIHSRERSDVPKTFAQYSGGCGSNSLRITCQVIGHASNPTLSAEFCCHACANPRHSLTTQQELPQGMHTT